MSGMHLGNRHQFLRRRGIIPQVTHKFAVRMMDVLAYTASSLSLLFTLDQIRVIWVEQNAAGVSLLSWIFYTISASVWLMYGYVHKDRILIITNSVWVLFSLFIVIGVALYG